MASYLVGRWILLPLAILLLTVAVPAAGRLASRMAQHAQGLFATNARVRGAAVLWWFLLFVAVGAVGLALGLGNIVVVDDSRGQLALGIAGAVLLFALASDPQPPPQRTPTEVEIDTMLAEMRRKETRGPSKSGDHQQPPRR